MTKLRSKQNAGDITAKNVGNTVTKLSTPFVWYKIVTSFFVALICLIVLIYFGIYFRRHYVSGRAHVMQEDCKDYINHNSDGKSINRTDCVYNVQFIDKNDVHYTSKIISNNKLKESGTKVDGEDQSMIDIEYDPKDPGGTATTPFSVKWIIVIASIIAHSI